MLECNYSKEPFDLRLTVLRLIKKAPVIILITLIGTLVFGGGYYIKNITLAPEIYVAQSNYKVNYATDPQTGNEYTYINGVSWNGWLQEDVFIQFIQEHLQISVDNEDLKSYLWAELPTDLRKPVSFVATPDSDMSLAIARALEKSFIDFGTSQPEISSIEVVTSATKTKREIIDMKSKKILDVRPARAFVLSGILTFFLTTLILSIWEIGNDSIWLPDTLSKRYGLKSLGTIHSPYCKENLKFLFTNKKCIGLVSIDNGVDLSNVKKHLLEYDENQSEYILFPTLDLCPEGCDKLRDMDGILLVVKAGSSVGKGLEHGLQFLETQECKITAAILCDADETLVKKYYRF